MIIFRHVLPFSPVTASGNVEAREGFVAEVAQISVKGLTVGWAWVCVVDFEFCIDGDSELDGEVELEMAAGGVGESCEKVVLFEFVDGGLESVYCQCL